MSGSRIFLIQDLCDACVRERNAAGLSGADKRNLDASLLADRACLWNGGVGNGHGSPFRQYRALLQDHNAILYSTWNDHELIITRPRRMIKVERRRGRSITPARVGPLSRPVRANQ
jgi:hypothetical protein